MNVMRLFTIVLAALLVVGVGVAQEKMTKDQWQQEINNYTAQRNDLSAKVKALTDQINTLQQQSSKLDDDYNKCMDDLYALVGSTKADADSYRSDIDATENTANELSRLSDADLMARSGDVDALAQKVKSLWDNKLSLIPEFYDRLTALNEKVKALQSTLGNQVKTYTVGTWARNRDCLWNISKKPDIYNNAWMWPKIWQGNRDQIKDPDVIHPGQKLKIPQGKELTADEKSAARKYYARKGK
ncbi:MAG TPA: LysM peptidoglycan-binding domain-containing protein [Bacteroidota bacterium]